MSSFDGTRSALGHTIRLDDTSFVSIGVDRHASNCSILSFSTTTIHTRLLCKGSHVPVKFSSIRTENKNSLEADNAHYPMLDDA
jgi:hypothetical protein